MNPLRETPQKVRVAGHRGHSAGAPENTLTSFRKARELGGAGVVCETDVTLTSDGELILIHDDTVDRTTDGRGYVQHMKYSELSKLDAGRWFGEEFSGERIPLLREALMLARELDFLYQVELKVYDQNDVLFPKLKALIDELDCADLVRFSSFDLLQLREIKKFIPYVPTIGHTHSRLINPVAFAREANVDAVSLEIQHFPSGEAKELHEADIAAFLYIPHPTIVKPLKAYGIDLAAQAVEWVREGQLDQIISDDVALMAQVKEEAFGY